MNLAIRSTAMAAVPRTRSRRIPPVGVFVPIRQATLRVARSSAVIFGQSIRPPVRRPPRQPAATGLSESAPAGGTATARVTISAELPAAGRRPLHLFHFASVVLHFECRIDRQSTPTTAPASRTLAESSPLTGQLRLVNCLKKIDSTFAIKNLLRMVQTNLGSNYH